MTIFESEFIENDIELELDLEHDAGVILGDQQQLKQVLINFIQNSIDFMPDGGKLLLKTSVLPNEKEGLLAFEITDSGSGISSDIIPNIFNPFFTTRDNGTGLGLAICHKIITDHGGSIEVRNNPGGGASFTIKLPLERSFMKSN